MKINTEKNYKAFKFLKGNRPIVPAKVKKLIDAVQSGLNLFEYCPVLVNNEMFVIDGQHRLEACKKLGFPVYYAVVPGVTLQQIATINSAQTRWKTSDFFNCFIQTGNKDYSILQLFQDKYGLSTNIAVQLLMNGGVHEGGSGSEIFKEGKFRVVHQERAEKLMRAVNQYQDVAPDEFLKNRSFIKAIQTLLASPDYDHQAVVEKLKQRGATLIKKSNYKEYIYHIEEMFNRGNKHRQIIYKSK